MRLLYAEKCLVKVPDRVSNEEAVLVGDLFPTGFHGAKQAETSLRDVVAAFRCGPTGIGAIISFSCSVRRRSLQRTLSPSNSDLLKSSEPWQWMPPNMIP